MVQALIGVEDAFHAMAFCKSKEKDLFVSYQASLYQNVKNSSEFLEGSAWGFFLHGLPGCDILI